VVAVRHETKGQTLVAFVVPNGNHLQSQLRQDTLIEQFKNSGTMVQIIIKGRIRLLDFSNKPIIA